MEKGEYRIETIILHNNEDNPDIVDGQQRIISISLFLLLTNKENELPIGANSILNHKYNEISQANAKRKMCYFCKGINKWQTLNTKIP